ncbi:TPA: isoprenylcysteine carboxylmethyltransferase family protein [Pasteurella multocida]|nr:isoprenylcysteine carboxylmethyltransferase family protein [Pasteurella multocida]
MASVGIGYFVFSIYKAYIIEPNIILFLMLLAEVITFFLVIVSKFTDTRDFNIIPVLLTILATFYFFAISLNTGFKIVYPVISILFMLFGIAWQIFSKIYLGRSFGLLPAYRNIVDTGPYRLVRHPIYFGYFMTHVGFLLNQFSFYNLFVFIILYCFQFGRMYYEERILSRTEEYCKYKERVKKRFIPFIL